MRHGSPPTPRTCALHCWNSPRRRWPAAVALVMWNMKRRHSFHSCKTAAARMAVKGAPYSGAFIGAKRRPFTATAAEATVRQRAGMLAAPDSPPERRQPDKELISSPRELNSFLSGMEYRSHSGAKRRLPRLRQREPRPTDPAPPRPCIFNKLTPQQPESVDSHLTALFSTVAI